jgi:DNA-binding beta-propeller fold protein YncE
MTYPFGWKNKLLTVGLILFFAAFLFACKSEYKASPAITSDDSTVFTEGIAGTFTVTASGEPAPTVTVTGTLPGGVTLDAMTGILSGTPAYGAAGTYSLTITAHNGSFFDATKTFELTVNPGQTFGVVALFNVADIAILDASTQTATVLDLSGQLGSEENLLDVAIAPDGKTVLVSNFGDAEVFFIDTSGPAAPVVRGSVILSYYPAVDPSTEADLFAEDIAVTPDGRYVLVTDGGFSNEIAVIDIENATLVEVFESEEDTIDPLDPWTPYHQAVLVAPDGETVLTADYFNRKVHVHTLSADGHLAYVSSIDVSNPVWDEAGGEYVETLRPINLEASPDGQTVIVATVGGGYVDAAETIEVELAFPVLTVAGPGQVTLTDMANVGANLQASQSIVFNRDGTKAYLHCTQFNDYSDPAYTPDNMIAVLDVTETGKASDAGTRIVVEGFDSSGQLFGVDTLAVDNPGEYLYVSNPNPSGSSGHIKVVDIDSDTVVNTITFDPVDPSDPDSDPALPIGIDFWHP